MIDKDLLDKLEKHKDEDVRKLVNQCNLLIKNPDFQGFKAIRKTIEDWNQEITGKKIKIIDGDEEQYRVFEKAYKYITTIDKVYSQLDFMKKRLSSEEAALASQQDTSDVDTIRTKLIKESESL
jgi:hypothetical protein